ncbi:hypothetical protein [Chitinophaga alhagiae]|uniref:hypothetical protein n=1 Tax=Chitinophaga alhagiae TaxID=2203219 RepID=UPI000E5A8F60|nr:hypothetical protein [Chitinophaga alhagiae]
MKNKHLFPLCLFAALLFSCKKKDGPVVIDTDFTLKVSDTQGRDLLDPQTGAYHAEDIQLFYIVNGEKVPVYSSSRDLPKNFELKENAPRNEHLLRIFPNTVKEARPQTLIQWNSAETDTITCEFQRPGASLFLSRIWLNGVLQWELSAAGTPNDLVRGERFFEIIK